MRSLSVAAALVAGAGVAGLAGCAAYGPGELKPGDSEAAVVRRMGPPTARHAMAEGVTRLVFARGPEGQHTWMVELGRDGRVLRWHQALGEVAFERITPGLTVDDLLRDYGPPAVRQRMGWQPHEVWSWRYPTLDCRWFQVTLDASRRVIQTGYAPDPRCVILDDML